MVAVIINVVVIMAIMWAFFRFMYPKPKQSFLPKAGEDSRPRACDHCGQVLASHRGVYEKDGIETTPLAPKDDPNVTLPNTKTQKIVFKMAGERFFCNYEHRAAFYQSKGLDHHQKDNANEQ